MNESKFRQYNRQKLLQAYPWCIYCGAAATTTDHCPPRALFKRRQWPEGYEFPACDPCNQAARADEQVLAVLVRIKLAETNDRASQAEWERQFKGLRNNNPAVVKEWQKGMGRNEVRRSLRRAFGEEEGDALRWAGYGSIWVGPITLAAIARFQVKLGKALYCRHNGHPLDGVIYAASISSLERELTAEFIEHLLRIAPETAVTQRSGKSLIEQFIYRFNHHPELGVLYALVRFSEQLYFRLIALSHEMDRELLAYRERVGLDQPLSGRFKCSLQARIRPASPPA